MADPNPLVALASDAIRAYVTEGRILEPPLDQSEEMQVQSGVFVCIKKHGELRGCIGTIEPQHSTVAREIIQNAINAAVNDFRFLPVEEEELDALTCSVDVLTPPEPVNDHSELDPKRYGVIVECGERRGLLLPDLEGVDTVADQVSIATRKAGIRRDEQVQLYRFGVKRYD